MKEPLPEIGILYLAIAMLPALAVLVIIYRWSLGVRSYAWAILRMLVQLSIVGYVLTFIFRSDQWWIILTVLLVMLSAASWIGLGPVSEHRLHYYSKAWIAVALGGGVTLYLITQAVLQVEPWFKPRYVVPLGGMTFSVAMNAMSIAAERFFAEHKNRADYWSARNAGMKAALIPITNSLLSVGIVSLPGMMTGQILAGTDPLVAAKYQIMVMGMFFGSGGLSAALFLFFLKEGVEDE